jgi:hypothetical protein
MKGFLLLSLLGDFKWDLVMPDKGTQLLVLHQENNSVSVLYSDPRSHFAVYDLQYLIHIQCSINIYAIGNDLQL